MLYILLYWWHGHRIFVHLWYHCISNVSTLSPSLKCPKLRRHTITGRKGMYKSCFLWAAISPTFPSTVNQTANMACSVWFVLSFRWPSIRCEKKAVVNSRCSQQTQTKLHLLTSTTWLLKRTFLRCVPVSVLLDRCEAVDYVCTAFLLTSDVMNANRGIYFISRNIMHWFTSIKIIVTIRYFLKSVKSVFILVQCNTSLSKNYIVH